MNIKTIIDSTVFRFVVVGVIGFTIDSSVMLLLMQYGISPFIARIPSFTAAVFVTWLLNRIYSFKSATVITNIQSEGAAYFVIQTLGAGVNYLTFAAVLLMPVSTLNNPLIALLIAAAAGMVFNFFGLKKIVFR